MDRFAEMGVFAAVAELGSFAEAGRRLGLSPPAVTRAVAALEARLGVRLLARTTRSVRATEAGVRFLADCRRILAEVAEAEEGASGASGAVRGEAVLTAPVMLGRLAVAPLLPAFLDRHPEAAVRTLFVDRVVDLIEEGVDVGVRIAALGDASMIAVRVGEVRRLVAASPAYLAAAGTPRRPEDLAGHRIVVASSVASAREWSLPDGRGGRRTARIAPRLVANDPDTAIAAALSGFGIVRVPDYQVADALADGRLVELFPDAPEPPTPVHVVHHEGRRTSAKVRALVDHLVVGLRADPRLARR
jgi:DNA-binding transcriptional LysR family regulator